MPCLPEVQNAKLCQALQLRWKCRQGVLVQVELLEGSQARKAGRWQTLQLVPGKVQLAQASELVELFGDGAQPVPCQ